MDKSSRAKLEDYFNSSSHRRTPERFAIADACDNMKGSFSMQQLQEELDNNFFHVSRATLYNTIKLFVSLRILHRVNTGKGAKYELVSVLRNQTRQACVVCGKEKEINAPMLTKSIANLKLKRFKQDGFNLTIYGVCSTCQAKITRTKNH